MASHEAHCEGGTRTPRASTGCISETEAVIKEAWHDPCGAMGKLVFVYFFALFCVHLVNITFWGGFAHATGAGTAWDAVEAAMTQYHIIAARAKANAEARF